MSEQNKFDSTYSAVLSIANNLIEQGKYDSTYSAVLSIYQNLTGDTTTSFDSVYSIVVNIAEGIESGEIDLGGGSDIELVTLNETVTYNGLHQFVPVDGVAYNQVDITVDIPNETLTQTITTNGTYDYAPSEGFFNGVSVTVDVPTGGGGSDENGPRNTHQFYDYLGNLVEEWTLEETQEKTELPTAPGFTLPDGTVINHDGWNWDLERLKEIGTPQNVGSFYRPSDDKPRFVADVPQDHLTLYLGISQRDTIDIDWGDGSVSSHEYGSGLPSHTYSSPGTYVIKCSHNKWKLSFIPSNTSKLLDYKIIKGIINYNYGGSKTPTGPWATSEPLSLSGLTNLDYITFNDYNGVIGDINSSDNYIYKVSNRCLCLPRQLKFNPVSGYDSYQGSLCEIICYPDDWGYSVDVENYSRIKTITFPKTYTSIGIAAFRCCSGLTSIEIPDSVTSIGTSAFKYCSGLTSIEIPDSVTSIGDTAFYGCSSLTSITIPNSVTSIGENAFQYCYGLKSVIIGNSVTSIGSSAFQYCYGLTSVVMGNSVTSIGGNVFNSIKEIIIDFSNCLQVPTLSSTNAFDSTALILVPESLYDEWIASTNWSSLTSQIVKVSGK